MKVLVAIDKSSESHMALAYTCHLLEHFDADVHALYVKPDEVEVGPESFYAPFFSKDGLKDWIDSDALQVQEKALGTCQYCLAGKVPCEPLIATGDPAEEILETAQQGDYDMIVLGSHGRSALRGFLLGTVHAKILHHTKRPIPIARDFREIKSLGGIQRFAMRPGCAQIRGSAPGAEKTPNYRAPCSGERERRKC
jgi:nucleotide-binding universal stress UspA family protein